jgi:subtilase family serine protease
MISAICPSCHIIYVGANSASFNDLATAVDTAARLGATVISNSYGGSEFSTEATIASHYNHSGVAITVSSGDSGYGVQVPAAFNTVTAVGGTTLTLKTNGTRVSETVWSGAGSGCSAYITKPTWQIDTLCAKNRTVADVAAVADPATGVAVYDTYGSRHGANWYVFGGTSVAAPIIGAVYALSAKTAGVPASLAYTKAKSLFDVTSGSNGSCGGTYLCTGGRGYDGPTGNGTPNGAGAF